MTILLSITAGFLLGIAALVFALQNNEIVALNFLNWEFESSLAVVTLMAVLVGVLMYALLALPGAIRSAVAAHTLRRENKMLREQLAEAQATVVVAPPPVRPDLMERID